MSLVQIPVRVKATTPGGVPLEGARIVSTLTRLEADVGLVVRQPIVGVTDAAGVVDLPHWPNARGLAGSRYKVQIWVNEAVIDSFFITVPDVDAGSWPVLAESIINQAPYPAVDAAQAAVALAQAAAIDAANASRLTIGTVTTGAPAATITGVAGAQQLNLVLPEGGGGGGAGATNLAYTASPTQGVVTSDTGTDATIPAADAVNAGLMTPAQFAKVQATSGTNTGDQDLSGLVPTSRSVNGHPLSGNVTVTAGDVGLGNVNNTADADKPVSTAQAAALSGKQPSLGFTPVDSAALGVSVATLVEGKVPSVQLPGFVDDVLEYANLASLPGTGEAGILYITLDTNRQYRWAGSAYAEINPSPGSTDAVPEGSVNLYHTAARVRAALLDGINLAVNAVISAGDSVLGAMGKLQKQITDALASLASHTGNTSNPHSVTAAQAGADASGTAVSVLAAHTGAGDPHTQYALESALGTAAAMDHGTANGNLVRLDATTGKLPAVDGSLLTSLPAPSIAPLVVEDANTVAQRNGVTAQNQYIYNSRTNASNYERLRVGWASNRVELRTEALGTGALRGMNLPGEVRLMPHYGNLGEYVSLSVTYRNVTFGCDVGGVGVVIAASQNKVAGFGTSLQLSTSQNYGTPSTITIQAADPWNNNLNGGAVLIAGQNGGNISGNNNSGGAVNIVGGTAAGSGTSGAVNLAYTGSAALGAVKCWGALTMDALLFPKPCTTATRPSWVNGATVFDTDLDKLLIGGVSGWEVVTSI